MSFLDKLGKIKDLNEMRKQAKEVQSVLSQERITGTSSNGHVSVMIDGNQNVLSVEIKDEALADKQQLERSTKDALSRALDGLKKLMVSKFSGMLK